MNLYCIKFVINNNIEIKHEIDGKVNVYSYCADCGFKQVGVGNEE